MKEIYLVKAGESIGVISNLDQNQINKDKELGFDYVEINSGADDIVLVKNYRPYYVYTFKNNDNLNTIRARGFEILCEDNDITPNDKIILTKPRSIRHIVSPMETLEIISDRYNIDKQEIIRANNLKSEKLFIGQILWV